MGQLVMPMLQLKLLLYRIDYCCVHGYTISIATTYFTSCMNAIVYFAFKSIITSTKFFFGILGVGTIAH